MVLHEFSEEAMGASPGVEDATEPPHFNFPGAAQSPYMMKQPSANATVMMFSMRRAVLFCADAACHCSDKRYHDDP